MPVLSRTDRAAIRISGPEAQKFLNNVLTAEIEAAPEAVHWWALLSPQGKIQAEGLAGWHDDGFWLDVAAEAADNFLKRMKLYRLRAKAEIEDMRESHAVGWSAEMPESGLADRDPRGAALGYRVIAPREEAVAWQADDSAFARARIRAGVAEMGSDFAFDTTFPHDIGMDLLSGIDFEKGCYVGQEVVSRMQHRGTARRRPVIVNGIFAEAGTPVRCGGREVGTLGRVVDSAALAVLRLDRLTNPEAATVAEQPVQLALPEWAGYRFGDSGSTPDTDKV